MKWCLKRAQITTTPTNEAFILLGLMTCTGHQREKNYQDIKHVSDKSPPSLKVKVKLKSSHDIPLQC